MAVRPDRQPDARRGAPQHPSGEVSYRLARQAVLTEFRKGRIARHALCDAHPELARAARNVGEESSQECPVCAEANVVMVSYVFGPRMPPQGRCVSSKAELTRLARSRAELACYVVEVCPACSWNHLSRSYALAPGRSPRSAPSG